jgi:hypothetical protein
MEDRIQAALADLESQAMKNYAATAKRWDIERTTLARRHQRKTTSRSDAKLQVLPTTHKCSRGDSFKLYQQLDKV